MLIIRANSAMDAVFRKTIKVMGLNVAWDGRLVFNNNTLILPGALKSLLFSFDNRKIIGTVIDEELTGDELDMPSDRLMENSVNLVLYVFGKWNLIKGLTVKQDYPQINSIFNSVLGEVGATIEATGENCRFYKDGIRITYEEVIGLVLEYLQPDTAEELTDEADGQGAEVTLEERHKIGLWHKILWKSADVSFSKDVTTMEQRRQSRMGMHFYCTGYKCPACGEHIHMTVYPEGLEETIDTDEGKVVIARTYTCPKCVTFYTPRPDRVIMDGEVYVMDFEEDTVAYADYLEMISKNGDRTSNGSFNRYLSGSGDIAGENPLDRLKEIFANVKEASDEEIMEAWEKSDAAMVSEEMSSKLEKKLHREVRKRGLERKAGKAGKSGNAGAGAQATAGAGASKTCTQAVAGAGASMEGTLVASKAGASMVTGTAARASKQTSANARAQGDKAADASGYDKSFLAGVGRMSKAELEASQKELAQLVRDLDDDGQDGAADRQRWLKSVLAAVAKQLEQIGLLELKSILSGVGGACYKDVAAAYESISAGTYPKEAKAAALNSLKKLMQTVGKREMDDLLLSLPSEPTLKEYNAFKERLNAYSGIDNSGWLSRLDASRDAVEKRELAEYVRKNNKRPKDRKALVALADAVGKLDYLERNKAEVRDDLLKTVRRLDEAKVEAVCGKLMDLDYDDSLDAYHNIFKGDFLPDIKEDALGRIIRRLEGIKKDECRSLIGKLVRDTGVGEGDVLGVHVYDVARMWKRECDDADAIIFHNANYCFAPLSAFEYPLMVYDASRGNDGKKGFLLTPDAIYCGGGDTGRIKIGDIERIYVRGGLFGKGIYAETANGAYRLANRIKDKGKLEGYFGRLSRFIGYLKEKPISRNAEYLIHEKHEIKCCLRCGHVYGVGNECPKCGNIGNG